MQSRFDKTVGQSGVDTNEMTVRQLYQAPSIAQLALGIIVGLNPNPHARCRQPQHRAWIGTMNGDFASVFEPHISQKSFIAPNQ